MSTTLLTLRQLARAIGVSERWLRAEADAGRIPSLRVKKHLYFNREAVERNLLDRAAKGEGTAVAHA